MENSGKPSLRRRKYIIDKSYQYRFISVVLLSILLIFILCLVLVLSVLGTVMDELFDVPGAAAHYPALLNAVLVSVWPWLIVILGVGFLLSLLISHQIAGPIYRLKMVSRDIRAGNFKVKVKFRKHDQLHDVAAAVNSITGKLSEVIKDDHKLLKDANELLKKIDSLAESGSLSKDGHKRIKGSLRRLMRQIEGRLTE